MKKIFLLLVSLISGFLAAQQETSFVACPTVELAQKSPVNDLNTLIKKMERDIAIVNFLDDLCSQIIKSNKPYFSTEKYKEDALRDLSWLRIKILDDKRAAIEEINTAIHVHRTSQANHVACEQLQTQLQTFETLCNAAFSKLETIETLTKDLPVIDTSALPDNHTRELQIMIAQMDLELWKYKFLHHMAHLARDKKYISVISLTNDEKLAVSILGMLATTALTESARKTTLKGMATLNDFCSQQSNNVLCEQLRKKLNTFESVVNNAVREGGKYLTDLINQPATE